MKFTLKQRPSLVMSRYGKSLLFIAVFVIACAGSSPSSADGGESPIVVGNARFSVITPQCIRMEYNSAGKFIDAPSYFAVNRTPADDSSSRVSEAQDSLTIDTGVVKLTYKPDGKPFSAGNLQATIKGVKSPWTPGMENKGNLKGAFRTLDNADGYLNLDDGLLSRDGWYLIDDSKSPLFGNDWFAARPSNSGTDWYFFGYGDDYKSALKSLTVVGGSIPLPRKYGFGAWYSRYWPYTSDEYHSIVKEYGEHDFPLDVMVMDMDWHKDGWTGWSWNRKLLPDAEDLLKWFHGQGLAVTLNVHPADGIQQHEDMYPDFTRAMGKEPSSKTAIPFDAGDKHYLDTLFAYTHNPLENEGVDFWWLDWQQYQNTRSVPQLTNLAALNEYYFDHTSAGGERGMSFSRWAGWGDHRHPIHFSGDASTNWKMLAFEVPFTSTSSNSGCFFWTHDIGGHMRGRNEESYARWCQFGAFTAALRSHSTRDASMDRRPWTYPKWAEDSMRISFHLRSLFFPYTYSSARESCMETLPLIRPMYIDYPDAEAAYKQPQQYLYGDDILVAPIAEPGIGPQKIARQVVWFPKGVWYNYFTGERFSDNKEHLVTAGINDFPLYVRGGVPVPMQAYSARMATDPLKTLTIRCYPGENGKTGAFNLYEDDGITDSYKSGKFATTSLSYKQSGSRVDITIKPTEGSFDKQVDERSYVIELPCTMPASNVTIFGGQAKKEYDAATHTNIIQVPSRSIRKGFTVRLTADESPAEDAAASAFARKVGLQVPAPGTTVGELLKSTLDPSGGQNSLMVLASAGIGSFDKIESPYGNPEVTTIQDYWPDGIPASIKTTKTVSDDGVRFIRTEIEVFGKKLWENRIAGLDIKTLKDRDAALSAKMQVSSSETPEAIGLNDGIVGGYPAKRANEWATAQEKVGAWAKLSWDKPQSIDRVVLFDRPNLDDNVLGGVLEFSDGTKLTVGELQNDASRGRIVSFPAKAVTWIKFTVSKVSPQTQNTGLSELMALKPGK